MSTRELVTLQIGHYANFTGTHLWNLQSAAYSNADETVSSADAKEINFDVTFREGRTLAGEVTYTPRAIFFDLKGSLNTLKQDGVLYDLPTPTQQLQWPANVSLHEFSGAWKNDFLLHLEKEELNSLRDALPQSKSEHDESEDKEKDTKANNMNLETNFNNTNFDLDKVVKVWSDYLKPHLHHKTVCVLPQHNHDDEGNFNMFSLGKEACKKQMLEIEDRLHFFTEECDNFQGFHLLVDAHDGFSGFAGYLYEDYIEDEFNNKSCFVINTIPQMVGAQKCPISLLNMFLSIDSFSSCSGILPMSTMTSIFYNAHRSNSNSNFPFLEYNPTLHYHTSAILASAINNFSLPYRLMDHVSHLGHHISSLTNFGRKVLGLQLSLPFESKGGRPLFDLLKSHPEQLNRVVLPGFETLTPGMSSNGKVLSQNATISGLSNDRLFGSEEQLARLRYSSVEDMLQDYLSKVFKTQMNNIQLVKKACYLCEPYPHIFSPEINRDLAFSPSIKRPRIESNGYPSSLPVATLLQNNSGVAGHLGEILEGTEKIQKDKMERYLDGVMEIDDFKEKLDNFKSLIEAYEDIQPDMF